MNQTVVTCTDNPSNHSVVFTVQNTDRKQLSQERDFICREIADMKLLFGDHVVIGELEGSQTGVSFQVQVPHSIQTITGAYEWLEKLIRSVEG